MIAAFGMFEHVRANHDAGPLDARYSVRWEMMSARAQWWVAVSKGVGPSPPLAPAVLAQAALCLGLATLQHPVSTAVTELRPGPAAEPFDAGCHGMKGTPGRVPFLDGASDWKRVTALLALARWPSP